MDQKDPYMKPDEYSYIMGGNETTMAQKVAEPDTWVSTSVHQSLEPVTCSTMVYQPMYEVMDTSSSTSMLQTVNSTSTSQMDTNETSSDFQQLQNVTSASAVVPKTSQLMSSPSKTVTSSCTYYEDMPSTSSRRFDQLPITTASHTSRTAADTEDRMEHFDQFFTPYHRSYTEEERTDPTPSSSKSYSAPQYDEDDLSDQEMEQHMYRIQAHNNKPSGSPIKMPAMKCRKGPNQLPKDMANLMGQANVLFAKGDMETARRICNTIIKEAPYAAEPYSCLALIFKDDLEVSLCCRLVAAHLSSQTTSEDWQELAEVCRANGDNKSAVDCYRKAAKSHPNDHELLSKAAKLHLDLGNFTMAMQYYQKQIAALPKTKGKFANELAYKKAMECHKRDEGDSACELLKKALIHHSDYFGDKECNTLCELLSMKNDFEEVLICLEEAMKVRLTFDRPKVDYEKDLSQEEERPQNKPDFALLTNVEIHSSLAVDLQLKAIVAIISIGRKELVKNAVKRILQLDSVSIGDLQYDIAVAYMKKRCWDDGLKALNVLLSCEKYCHTSKILWKRAECLTQLKRHKAAADDYHKCLEFEPQDVNARIPLSKCYVETFDFRKAISILDEAENYPVINGRDRMKLLFQRYEVFLRWAREPGKKKKFAAAADVALIMFANKLRSSFNGQLAIIKRTQKSSNNPYCGEIKLVHNRMQHPHLEHQEFLDGDEDHFTVLEWFHIFKTLLRLLINCKRYAEAVILNNSVKGDRPLSYHAQREKMDLELLGLRLSLLANWHGYAYDYIKSWVLKYTQNKEPIPNHLWNIFNQIVMRTGDSRHHKFCTRQLFKNPGLAELSILKAHEGVSSGSYRFALVEYLKAANQFKDEPLLKLLIGIVYIHIMCQKKTEKKHALLIQGFAFLVDYARMRGYTQETYYNIGRALQQIGLNHFAIHTYREALEMKPPKVDDPKNSDCFDLKSEIAYNLSLIYRKSGNHAEANHLLMKYIVV